VDLSFKAEVRYGETVRVEAEPRETPDGLEVLHRVLRKGDGAELAVARSRWGAVGD
jgi:acyl-CoA thioesterase FadM